jgi:hypothetical protein
MGHQELAIVHRDGEYKYSRGPTFGDFCHYPHREVDAGRHGCKCTEYRLPTYPSFKCNVLRESLSEDSQNIPLCNIKEKGAVGNLFRSLSKFMTSDF